METSFLPFGFIYSAPSQKPSPPAKVSFSPTCQSTFSSTLSSNAFPPAAYALFPCPEYPFSFSLSIQIISFQLSPVSVSLWGRLLWALNSSLNVFVISSQSCKLICSTSL